MDSNPYAQVTNLPLPPPPVYNAPARVFPNYQPQGAPQYGSALQQQPVLNISNVSTVTRLTPQQQLQIQHPTIPPEQDTNLEGDGESEDTGSPISVVNKPEHESFAPTQGIEPAPQYQDVPQPQTVHTTIDANQPATQLCEDQYQQTAHTNASSVEEPSSEIGYFIFGILMAAFFGLFAFCFLLCPDCMGLVGQKKKSFIVGAAIGVMLKLVVSIFVSYL